jgi:hypothetical protein
MDRQAPRPPAPARATLPWPTGRIAFVGWTGFVSGLFVLVATGGAHGAATLALTLGAAAVVALAVGTLMLAVAATEALARRAWASGFRTLDQGERTLSGVAVRGLRYAGVIWAANGAALWVATFTSRW